VCTPPDPPPLVPIQRREITSPAQKPNEIRVEIDYQKLIDLMAADGRFIGPPGRDGAPGADGTNGRDGADAKIDIAAIAAALPPIYPLWIDREGKVIDELPGGVRLGQTLPLRVEVINANPRPD